MKKYGLCILVCLLLISSLFHVEALENNTTPSYNVSFFAYDCFNIEDKNGKKSGYGYEMLENISHYFQGTFNYIGYDLSANECIQLLDEGKIDLYTAAKKTSEREEKYIFSKHPIITSTTCMTIKVGNTKIVSGDYSTYQGIKIGLLERHTYNSRFENFAKSKGFSYEITYYDTLEKLTQALINGEVDALVNSYISTPEDEKVIEKIEETPYYFMARKESQDLIDEIDEAIDTMNIEMPNWRTDLFNLYYGLPNRNVQFSTKESAYLQQLQESQTSLTVTFNPDQNPYSYLDEDKPKGVLIDLFEEVMNQLDLNYTYITPSSKQEYEEWIKQGKADLCIDLDSNQGYDYYKTTSSYLSSTISLLQLSSFSGKVNSIGVIDQNLTTLEIKQAIWENGEMVEAQSLKEGVQQVLSKQVDGLLLKTYEAEKLAQNDIRNRLKVDIVPEATCEFYLGIHRDQNYLLYGLLEKSLTNVTNEKAAGIVQSYLEMTVSLSAFHYLATHPKMVVFICSGFVVGFFFIVLYLYSLKSKKEQQMITQELSIALQQAKEANESKQDFFSKMSHDIRTPLNVVLGMSQISKKYKQDPKRLEEALNSIQSEGNYLLSLINSILDVNQLEHGHIELQNEPFDLVDCFNHCVEILTPLAMRKKQSIYITCSLDEENVIGDSNRFSQIMINIISNAIKYTDEHGTIELSLEKVNNQLYRFTCKDNGIGMSEKFVQHICEEYVRAEDSRTSKTEGTGLGMSVVKGFTELMHGSLKIESKLHVGSSFSVEIPFEKVQIAKVNNIVPTKEPFINTRVLLAEDNPLNAEIAIELMQTLGLQVDWVDNGKKCLDTFIEKEEGYYQAIFMDLQMPIMDGLEATRKIRACDKKDRMLPIIAITANTFTSDREACKAAGMTSYVSKPIHIKDIESLLKSLLQEDD